MNSESLSVRTEEVPPCKNRHCVTRNITERKLIEKPSENDPRKSHHIPTHSTVWKRHRTQTATTQLYVCGGRWVEVGERAFYLGLHCLLIYRELSDEIISSS